jgi:hypothetical protein
LSKKVNKMEGEGSIYPQGSQSPLGTIRQFIEVALLASLGSCLTVAGALWKLYDVSTVGVLLLVVGTILFFVRGPRYFDETIMRVSTLPFLKNMSTILDSLDAKGKSLILPSNSGFEQMLLVGAGKGGILESALLADSTDGGSIAVLNAEGGEVLRLAPLGNDLAVRIASQIAEEKHQNLQQMFQRVEDILTDMGALSTLDVLQDGAMVKVTVEGLLSHFSCQELCSKYPRVCSQLLCPMCSALACLVSQFFRCPVAVEGASTVNGRTELSVRILEEAS